MVAIGTHCYNGSNGSFSSGNPIGGKYNNNYNELVKRFKPSTSKTLRLGDFKPKIDPLKLNFAYYEGKEPTDGKKTGFWGTLRNVLKVGGKALPAVGALGGPIGTFFGTVAGGIISSLAESSVIPPSPNPSSVTKPTAHAYSFQRAQLAEAALQSVLRLRPSQERERFWTDMSSTWDQHHLKNITNSEFRALVSPIINHFGFRLASDQWQKRVDPDPTTKHVKTGNDPKDKINLSKPELQDPNKEAFVDAFIHGGARRIEGETENAESLASWLQSLLSGAVKTAQPLTSDATKTGIGSVIKMIGGGSDAESIPADAQDADVDMILQRAVMADCALQILETMKKEDLEALNLLSVSGAGEGGVMDGLKIAVQQSGPHLIDLAMKVMNKHLPGIVKRYKRAQSKTSYIYDTDEYPDGNPDTPPPEPFSPAKRDDDVAPPKVFPRVETK
ncbi:hypothetical protein HC256_005577 [Beauveria bassiana]|nr:hypothetical protein HC256_005577 [Beauveria bassiana]